MTTIGEACEVLPGKTPSKVSYSSSGDVKIVKFRDVLESGVVNYSNNEEGWLDTRYADASDLVDLTPYTILLTNAAHSIEHIGKKVAYIENIPNIAPRICFVGELTSIRERVDGNYAVKWIYYWLQTNEAKAAIARSVEGAHLVPRQFKRIKLPQVSQQEQIAHILILSEIDDAITKAKAELAAAQQLHQSALRSLLEYGMPNQYAEFRQTKHWKIPSNWELVCVKHLIDNMDAGSSPMCEAEPAKPGQWGVLKVSSVSWERFEEFENKALPPTIEPDIKAEVKVGDIIVSRANTTALCGAIHRIQSLYTNLLLCDKTWRLHPKVDVHPDWLVAILKHPNARKQIEANATGTSDSMKNIAKRDFRNVLVPKPSHAEQTEIMGFLNVLRENAETQVAKVKALQEVKKSLLHNLLTGKVRVPEGVVQ